MTISWDEPVDNYDTITAYLIELRQSDYVTFTESAECDGSANAVVVARECSVLMETLRSEPYSLGLDEFVVARVKAMNSFGWAIDSQPNTGGAKIQTVPAKMEVPTYLPLESTLTEAKLRYSEPTGTTATGGAALDSYHLEMFNGLAWITYLGGGGIDSSLYSLDTEVVVSGLTGGSTYKFRVQAHNIHGWGERSDELVEIASGRPDQPDAATVQIVNLDVMVSWSAPASNHASITQYLIKFVQVGGVTFTEESTYCDGSQQLILLQRFCLVPHSVLTATPYSLTFDTLIEVKVQALNRNGWSDASDANVAGLLKDKIQTVPGAITSLSEGPLTATEQIQLQWQALEAHVETGGAEVSSYNIQWDAGQFGLLWEHVVGYEADMTATEYIVTQSVLPSYEYRFQIRAQNKWGWGDWSSVLAITASTWPDIVAQPTTSIDPADGNVILDWEEPSINGAAINQYVIEFGDAIDSATWITDAVNCNGQSQTVIDQTACSVPMSVFTTSLRYSLDDSIRVRVTAYNNKGQSEASSEVSTSSATAKVVPIQMPSSSITYGEATSEHQV